MEKYDLGPLIPCRKYELCNSTPSNEGMAFYIYSHRIGIYVKDSLGIRVSTIQLYEKGPII
jgi:hypothetical protein